ncbi:uncharacterized protein LOC131948087 [Physella acuta]|uniref:uncharacterized protein LOC131948087 n=1 Tax=Physella acuta TaxID=109671 RepID=UPI0027DB634D|nr:uncharacterized protein LOC131948087 [Physella acuta]
MAIEENRVPSKNRIHRNSLFPAEGPELCPLTGLTSRERFVITRSWADLMENGREKLAHDLLLWMMSDINGMREFFKMFKNMPLDQMAQDERFVNHSHAIVISLQELVNLLGQPSRLEIKLLDLITFHVDRRVNPVSISYFEQFRDKFHLFIVPKLKVDENGEEVRAWRKLFNTIVEMGKSLEKPKSSCCCLL